jgi:hypothetical protein
MKTSKTRKPKPKALIRVTYLQPDWETLMARAGMDYPEHYDKRTRFTVKKNVAWELVGIWDKKTGRWLYPCEPKTLYTTRPEAWTYLRSTREDDPEYKLARVNQALDGEDAA